MKILAIGAHFDDVEIGCGGSLLKHVEKEDKVAIAILKADDALGGDIEERHQEQVKSCQFIKSAYFAFRTKAEDKFIIKELDSFEADLIYIPFENDHHQDHRHCFTIGMAVGRRKGINILGYITPSSYNCFPTYFRCVDMKRKLELISLFKTQVDRRPDILERVALQDEYYRATLLGLTDPGDKGHRGVEGFVVYRLIEKD